VFDSSFYELVVMGDSEVLGSLELPTSLYMSDGGNLDIYFWKGNEFQGNEFQGNEF
jgi:hypothetical protein